MAWRGVAHGRGAASSLYTHARARPGAHLCMPLQRCLALPLRALRPRCPRPILRCLHGPHGRLHLCELGCQPAVRRHFPGIRLACKGRHRCRNLSCLHVLVPLPLRHAQLARIHQAHVRRGRAPHGGVHVHRRPRHRRRLRRKLGRACLRCGRWRAGRGGRRTGSGVCLRRQGGAQAGAAGSAPAAAHACVHACESGTAQPPPLLPRCRARAGRRSAACSRAPSHSAPQRAAALRRAGGAGSRSRRPAGPAPGWPCAAPGAARSARRRTGCRA